MLSTSFLVASLAALSSSVQGYRLCNTNNYRYSNQNLSIPITRSIGTASISGVVVNVDGCTLGIRNFTLTGAANVSLFGGNGTVAEGINLSSVVLPSNSTPYNINAPFITSAGNWVAYEDFDQLRFFNVATNTLIGVADFPIKNVVPPSPSPSPSPAAPSPTASPTDYSQPINPIPVESPAPSPSPSNLLNAAAPSQFLTITNSAAVIILAVVAQLL